MFLSTKVWRVAGKCVLFAILMKVATCATAAVVNFVAEGPVLAGATMMEIVRSGPAYVGQRVVGLVGDSVELGKGPHHLLIDGPNDYIFEFFVSVADTGFSISGVSIWPGNCKPELKAAWAGPKLVVDKVGVATVFLPAPKFGPPTGNSLCASPVIEPCARRRVALDVQTTPPGAEVWIDGHKQSARTNQLVEAELEVCNDKVDVLLRLPGKANCSRSVTLSGASTAKVTCAFVGVDR